MPWIVVVVVARPIVTPLALVVPIDTVPAVVVAVPVSMTMLPLAPAEALPVDIVVLLDVVPAVLVTVAPPAPCRVSRPAFVPQVAAAALVRVRAPVLVVKLLAAFEVMLTAPAVALPMVVVLVPVVLIEVVPRTETVLPVRPRVPVVLPTLVLPVPVPRLVAAAPVVLMLVVPVRPMLEPDSIAIAPVEPFPIVIVPVLPLPICVFAVPDVLIVVAPVTASPAFAVTLPLNVLLPANVCTPVLTSPGFVPSAVWRYIPLPDTTAPSALFVWLSTVPINVTPLPAPSILVAVHAVPSYIYVCALPA